MECYTCKKETDYKSPKYSDIVCLECETKFNESSKKTDTFRKKYSLDHKACPKCNGEPHTTTLVAYALYSDNLEFYKDLNSCKCGICGDTHTVHERVPKI
jgi:hypothetical protein